MAHRNQRDQSYQPARPSVVTGVARERVAASNANKNGASSRKRAGFTTKSRYIDELEGPHHRLPWGYLRHVKPISSSMLAYGQSCFIGSPVTPAVVEVSPGAMYQPCTRLRCMSPRDAFERYTSSADSPFHFSHPRTSERLTVSGGFPTLLALVVSRRYLVGCMNATSHHRSCSPSKIRQPVEPGRRRGREYCSQEADWTVHSMSMLNHNRSCPGFDRSK